MKYKCPLCPKSFQSKNKLERHTKKIHGIELKNVIQEVEKK